MPLYEYACGACGAVSEISHRISDPAPTDCPECGKSALSKQISAAGFRLKGEGWYETDFKSDGRRNLAGDSGASGGSSNGGTQSDSGGSAADSKPAAKPAASSSDSGSKAKAAD